MTSQNLFCPVCEKKKPFYILSQRMSPLKRCRCCGIILAKSILNENKRIEQLRQHYEQHDPIDPLGQARWPLFNKILNQIETLKKNGKILDIGCGGGDFLKLAADRGWEPYGVEISSQLRLRAKKKQGLTYIKENIDSFRFKKEVFDVIVFMDVLDQITKPAEYIRKAIALLKPGGVLLIRVRNGLFQVRLRQLFSLFHFFIGKFVQKPPFSLHVLNFTPHSLRLLLEKAGGVSAAVLNSPLTYGDPYGVFRLAFLSGCFKWIISILAQVIEKITCHKIILGPSLLAVVRKSL